MNGGLAAAAWLTMSGASGAPALAAPPPPILVMEASDAARRDRRGLATLEVTIAAGRNTLWSGSLRVGPGSASYNETLRQADEPCPTAAEMREANRYSDASQQLNITVSQNGNGNDFAVNARWQRPMAACEGAGNRGVSLEQRVQIAPGETVRLTGDGGLAITLVRRAQ